MVREILVCLCKFNETLTARREDQRREPRRAVLSSMQRSDRSVYLRNDHGLCLACQ